ncbi:MAG: hypothetical protein ACPK85_02420 [Methanosarcina sp.]
MPGQYCKKVMEYMGKQVAKSEGENKFQERITRLETSNMTYRVFTSLAKLVYDTVLRCNAKAILQL